MRKETGKRTERVSLKKKKQAMRYLAVLLIVGIFTGKAAPLSVVMAQILASDSKKNVASKSGWTATDADWAEMDEDEEKEENTVFKEEPTQNNTEVTKATSSDMEPAKMSIRADGVIRIEAEEYYSKTGTEGSDTYADLQPPNDTSSGAGSVISIPLNGIDGFQDGNYRIRFRCGGQDQNLKMEVGSMFDMALTPSAEWYLTDNPVEYRRVWNLSSGDTLKLSTYTDGKYTRIDWIELEPVEEEEIWFLAKDYVAPSDKVTGDDNSCANMDPGVKVEMTLDGSFKKGIYTLSLVTTGNDRTYKVLVNGKEVGEGYAASAGSDSFNMRGLHDDGWQGNYELKAGDVVSIVPPEGNYGWLKDVVWKWVSETEPDYMVDGSSYLFNAKKFYGGNPTGDGLGADLQPGESITIHLADLEPAIQPGKYQIQMDYAGNGQIMEVQAGSSAGELILSPSDFNWDSQKTGETFKYFDLTGNETLTFTADQLSGGPYTWVKTIRLVPFPESETWIGVEAGDSCVAITGNLEHKKCINMGAGDTITITLDTRFKEGRYGMQFFHTGDARTYGVSVNGKPSGTYDAPERKGDGGKETMNLEGGGWNGRYILKAGDTVTITAPEDTATGWIKGVTFKWLSDVQGGVIIDGDAYVFEGEDYYDKMTTDGNGADFQPGTQMEISLEKISGFKSGTYLIETIYAGNGQILKVEAGSNSAELILSPGDFDWSSSKTTETMKGLNLTGSETLIIKSEPNGKYSWIDKIRLVPTTEKRIGVEAGDSSVTITGSVEDGNCIHLGPGNTMTIKLDTRFEEGQYGLWLFHTGDARSYTVLVNGQAEGTYDVAESKGDQGELGSNQLTGGGWKGSYSLKAGDTVTITAPNDTTTGWIKGVTFKWLSEVQGGFTMEGDAYIFEGERYYDRLTEDKKGADLQPNTEIRIPLEKVSGFKSGNYRIEAVYAGNGQILKVETGNHSAELILSPGEFGWNNSKTAETMGILHLTGKETLVLKAVSEGQYDWIDKIRLVPTTEKRICLNVKDSIVKLEEAADGWNPITGDDGNCANMDPGKTLTINLDSRFIQGQYVLKMMHSGSARTYTVLVNGEEMGTYLAAGSGAFGMDQLLANGWQGRYTLKAGDVVTIVAPEGSYGWIKDIVWKEVPPIFYKKDPATGIVVEAEEGVLPIQATLSVKAVGKVADHYFSGEGMRAVGYQIELKDGGQLLDLTTEQREGRIQVKIPYPAGVNKENPYVDLYYVDGDTGENLFATADEGGLSAAMQGCGVYAVSMEKGIYHFEAEEYYKAWADNGNAANFEAGNGDKLSIPLRKEDGFDRGVYNLLIRYCGGGDGKKLLVHVNDKAVGSLFVPHAEWGDYKYGSAEGILELYGTNTLALVTPEGQYHWIDYVELIEGKPFDATESDGEISVKAEAPIGALPMDAQLVIEQPDPKDAKAETVLDRFKGDRIITRYIRFYLGEDRSNPITPSSPVTIRIRLEEINAQTWARKADRAFHKRSLQEESEPLAISLNGETANATEYDRSEEAETGNLETVKKPYTVYHVNGEGQAIKCSKVPSRVEEDQLVFTISKETGMFAIVEGGVFLRDDCGDEIYSRAGAAVGALSRAMDNEPVKTRTNGNHYIYEGEAYYKAQSGSLTADLQPGAQMKIPLGDNREFKAGIYRVTIRSNGNRQKFIIKVNDQVVGNVLRAETDFGMAHMTDDTMAETLNLSASDILTVEGESGNHYGWVDYVDLTWVGPAASERTGNRVVYQGADLYEKKAENYNAADLQPGDSLSFRAGEHKDFQEGFYQIGAVTNGNRTRLWVKINGEMAGSIVRVTGSGFEKSDFTMNRMNHTLYIRPDDVITLEAPGNEEEGPWGWVEAVQLIPAPVGTGQPKAEYRYDGEDFYQASLYSPAADLQPGTSIVIPVSNDPDFVEGRYRLSVLSNGTREEFTVQLNGLPVGVIRRKATDYSDIDYSQDYLDMVLSLKPGDVLTLTGQEGDFFGWVNYILLEREES